MHEVDLLSKYDWETIKNSEIDQIETDKSIKDDLDEKIRKTLASWAITATRPHGKLLIPKTRELWEQIAFEFAAELLMKGKLSSFISNNPKIKSCGLSQKQVYNYYSKVVINDP